MEIRNEGGGGNGSTIILETNGILNGDQTLLNLVAGTSATLIDDGFGNVTISVVGGTPAGTTADIQYNTGGVFDADATGGFTYPINATTNDRGLYIIGVQPPLRTTNNNAYSLSYSLYVQGGTGGDTSRTNRSGGQGSSVFIAGGVGGINTSGGAGNGGSGGDIEIDGGYGGSAISGQGGSSGAITMFAGRGGHTDVGTGGLGRDFLMSGGLGGNALVSGSGGTGGGAKFFGGNGGTSADGEAFYGDGGPIDMTGGNGHTGGYIAMKAGDSYVAQGGSVSFYGGDGTGSGDTAGGDILLRGGFGVNAGDGGNVHLYGMEGGATGAVGHIIFHSQFFSGYAATWDMSLMTADQTFSFPDATGTLALETAASDTFTTADAKTVTVVNGIITSIV